MIKDVDICLLELFLFQSVLLKQFLLGDFKSLFLYHLQKQERIFNFYMYIVSLEVFLSFCLEDKFIYKAISVDIDYVSVIHDLE